MTKRVDSKTVRTPATGKPGRQRPTPAVTTAPRLRPLPPHHLRFVHEYDANGGNGTRAYVAAYPACRSLKSAAQHAYLLLRNPAIRARLTTLETARWKRLQMIGDEALYRIALDARADIRDLHDEKGRLLPVHCWPDSIANSVRSIKPGPFGTAITLNDSQAARRIVLEKTGMLKNPLAGVGDLARILAGDFTEDD